MKKAIAEALERRINDLEINVSQLSIKAQYPKACGIETEPEYVITKEQIEILKKSSSIYVANTHLENWFPELVKPKLQLESGKWYVGYHYAERFLVNLELTDELETHDKGYGFDKFGWQKEFTFLKTFDYGFELATPEEVTQALTKEAVKRGFVEGAWFSDVDINSLVYPVIGLKWCEDYKGIRCNKGCVFHNGKWAEIIPTISHEDAEKELGKKILN